MSEPNPHKKLRPSGGYRDTASFQTSTLIYDATVWFCEKFLDSRSRTVDQMVQAARSGRRNIAEGSRAAATSSQTELRLVNVARASLEELLLDYVMPALRPLATFGFSGAGSCSNSGRQSGMGCWKS